MKAVIISGQSVAHQERKFGPLMYIWYGDYYVGAAHGLAGILYMLLQVHFSCLGGVHSAALWSESCPTGRQECAPHVHVAWQTLPGWCSWYSRHPLHAAGGRNIG